MSGGERKAGDVLERRYRLVDRLGQGGFGDVWRAEELLPDGKPLREVALKLLVRGVASDWTEEARIIASLRHPALVTIYAAGLLSVDERAMPFVAMELLAGENLAVPVERGHKVAWRRVLRWAREAAAALDEIHRAGVVHLDLKPANLFLTASGLKVLDFGIAKQGRERVAAEVSADEALSTAAFMAMDGASLRASTGGATGATSRSVVGTPGFMAPEVVEGGEATFAADAYALAACIVQLVGGVLPQDVRPRPPRDARADVEAWLGDVRSATLHGRLRDLGALSIPSALRELLGRWLRLDPMARVAKPGTLRAELDAVWARPHGASRTPFRGLEPYRLEDEGNFHGRTAEAERLGRELIDEPFVLVHGPPGAGLTSLALAGMVPELAKSQADEREDWVACHVVLGSDPEASFRRALAEVARLLLRGAKEPRDEARTGAETSEERGEASGVALPVLAEGLARAEVGLVLVLEDLAAVVEHPERGVSVLEALVFASTPRPGLRVVGLLHEDRLGAWLSTDVGRTLQPFLRFLGMPSWSSADDLVLGPARALGLRIEDSDAIVGDVKAELGHAGANLSVVGLALARLWEATPSARGWRDQGALVGPLARHAETVVSGMPAERRKVAEWCLLRMLRADGRTIAVERDALFEAATDETLARSVLDELVTSRVVVAHSGKVRLAHRGLVHAWARLNDRRLHDLERLSFIEELREAATRWRQLGAPSHELWGDEKLGLLEGRFRGVTAELRFEERAFVEASFRARRKARLVRAFVAVCVLASLVVTYLLDDLRRTRAREHQLQLEEANRSAAVDRLVTASRRTSDPYRRVAMLGAAIEAGSRDRLLPLELFAATRKLPVAHYLALEPPDRPRFPWDDRYLLGHTRSHLVLLDVLPDEGAAWGTVETRLSAHDEGIFDVEPFAFGHGFVSRGLDGVLKVWRLRENRQLALAAESPMRCVRGLSRVLVADRAPVVACVTADGLARWDLRDVNHVDTVPFGGRLLAIAPSGGVIAAASQRRVVLWKRGEAPTGLELPDDFAATEAAFSPKEPVLALVDRERALVFDVGTGGPRRLLGERRLEHGVSEPSAIRFAPGGVDLAIGSHDGHGAWLYLRDGGRAEEDGPEPSSETAYAAATMPPPVQETSTSNAPRSLRSLRDYGEVLLEAPSVGPRRFDGGFGFSDGRLMTRDLVVFDLRERALAQVTEVGDAKVEPKGRSVGAVARAGEAVVWQYGREVHAESRSGQVLWSMDGNLGAACGDGRVLAWRAAGDVWEVLDAEKNRLVRRVVRRPGFVLGIEPSCRRFYVQGLDGRIASVSLEGASDAVAEPAPITPGGGGYAIDGYVFDVRASAARDGIEAGLWLAFSSGAIARADASGGLQSFGHAAPRATAMGDGPLPGQLVFADDSGVFLRERGGQDRHVLAAMPEREWSDVRVLPDQRHGVLSWSDGLALVDLDRAELVGWTECDRGGRLAEWDSEGSMISWSFAHIGPPAGELVPLGAGLARTVALRASNLVAEPSAAGMPQLRLR